MSSSRVTGFRRRNVNSCCTDCNTKQVGSVIDDLLGIPTGGNIATVGISLEPQTILMLSAGVVGAGLLIKNLKF